MRSCSPGEAWTPICPWEAVNWFVLHMCVAFSFPVKLFLSHDKHEFVNFYLCNFFPNPAGGGVSEQLCDAWLLAGVKPWQSRITISYIWNMKKYILKIRLINVVLPFLWQAKILTAITYKTACEAFLIENSKTLFILLGHKNEQKVGKKSCNGNAWSHVLWWVTLC